MQEVIAVLLEDKSEPARDFQMRLEECQELIKTAGGKLVATLTQAREQPDPRTYIGQGKLQELKSLAETLSADLIIFYDALSPSQVRNIESALDWPVIDRVQLILDIFTLRAHSKEAKLQVALVQNEYLLPRLAGQGLALSRLAGGIGTRGPGESQLERDRRTLRDAISRIKKQLKEAEKHREVSRERRTTSSQFKIGLVGYTNAGKSTILNGLTQAETYEEDQLFATLSPLTRSFTLENGFQMTLTDTVGFIQDLPPMVIDAFHSTLEESRDVDLLLIVIDASSAHAQAQEKTVCQLLEDLDMLQIPHLFVYNKMDQVERTDWLNPSSPNVAISARSPQGLLKLEESIVERLRSIYDYFELKIPSQNASYFLGNADRIYIELFDYDEVSNDYLIKGYKRPHTHLNP
ncbi:MULTISPECIES: GTPase HflX [Aerococcus]|uniref:GTPase HflX n=1 Tax=Aerococcus sanguinicola TaxID=119206 RepID=A0A5N1GM28_9LACT|nr:MULTISPECIES: GTPase HflX [Aerococcus]KAA9302027.1 GTPase HflX [Aerococcus sanguinicola]MDK6368549.1 GTPase HflX [Aerococcus sp. UMB9870]MDK6679632.1 GTPase HflX [Aerococcus sp. UMB8608]MDK6686476.1 GTPase HflX [Aerococcus sp. UMB8623]MDK6940902.1 GTPase HflX [Aerococcus sp. UMB8487]